MHISAVLKRKGGDVVTVAPATPVSDVTQLLTEKRIGAVVVVDGDHRPVGILSERDIVHALAAKGAATLDRPVSDLMTRDVITGHPDDTIRNVMALMTERRIRHLPVIDGGRLVGLVSIGDAVKARLDDAEMEVESLRGFVAGIG